MGVVAVMVAYFVFLIGVIHFFRFHYKASAWVWVASLATIPLWIATGGVEGWFRWFKILSVILPLIVVGFSRIAVAEDRQGRVWDVLKSKQFLWFFYAILFLNIAEASVKDLQMGNYYNAMAGFLLCVTIPYAPKFWTFTKDGNAELIAYTTAAWNFLYTTWNLAFVYAEDIGGPHWAGTICILLAAELYPLLVRRPELYIMARIYTLGAHLLIRACWDFFPQFTPISLYSAPVTHWWGIINFVLALPYVFWFIWQLNVGTAPITFRRGTARKDYLESHPEMAVRVAKDHVSAI